MATTAIGLPIFEGKATDDIDTFIRLYMGYLDTINVDPFAAGGPPLSWKRAMGILRSCMSGEAAEWFDHEITGKNWELSGIRSLGGATLVQLVALAIPEGAGGPNVGTYVPGSTAQAYAATPANVAVTIRQAFIPTHDLLGGDEAWTRAGARPTDRPEPANADLGVGANNNQPIVLPGIKPNQALYWLRTQYPTILDEKRRIKFNSIYQENEPVDIFYNHVKKAGKLLKLSDDLINDQFFRGLTPENSLEAERFRHHTAEDLVKTIKNVERRKNEIRLGQQERNRRLQAEYDDASYGQIPPLGKQEPVVLKPVTDHGISREELNKLLQEQFESLTKSFQVQLQRNQPVQPTLQQRPLQSKRIVPPVIKKSPIRRVIYDDGHDDSYDPYYDERPDEPTEEEASQWTEEDVRRHNRRWDEYNRRWNFDEKRERDLANKIARKLKLAKARREDAELSQAMRDLTLEDNSMDVDVVRGKLELVEDEDGSISIVRTGKKK